MQADIDKFNFIAEISLYDLIQKYVPDGKCLKKLINDDDFIEMIDVAYAINNKTDVVIRLKEKPKLGKILTNTMLMDIIIIITKMC